MMTILLIKGLSLPGATIGLKFLFYPDWSKLKNLKVWEDAVVQIAYSSGICFGPLMLYGSARK
jgi:SNF family Na+-dependent transporter